jgi:hypothetical protein
MGYLKEIPKGFPMETNLDSPMDWNSGLENLKGFLKER